LTPTIDLDAWPFMGGEMAQKVRSRDWSATPLGDLATWSGDLKAAVANVLAIGTPAALAWGPELVMIYNDSFRPFLGDKPEALGQSFAEVWAEVWHEVGPIAERAFAGEATFIEDFPLTITRSGRAEQAYFTFSYNPVRNKDGRVLGMIDIVVETTGRVKAQTELRQSEQRLQTLVDGVPQLVWRANEAAQWSWASPQWTQFTGQSEAASRGLGWLEPVHPDDRDAALAQWAKAREDSAFEAEYRIRSVRDGRYRWFQTRAAAVRDAAGTIVEWLGTSTDVQDIKEAQGRQELLLAELQHRVRNLLGMVRSIMRQSVERHTDVEDYVAHLVGRLNAMARTQVLLTRAAGASVSMQTLVWDELESYLGEGTKITIEGPDVSLSAKCAEVLTLAVHELATNSVKYGAVAYGGTLAVEWSAFRRDGRDWLRFLWAETCLRAVASPTRRGFGTELIEGRIPYELRGEASLTVLPTGARAEIAFPLMHGSSIFDAGPQPGVKAGEQAGVPVGVQGEDPS
jgi:PAS domain S-box-containing protein